MLTKNIDRTGERCRAIANALSDASLKLARLQQEIQNVESEIQALPSPSFLAAAGDRDPYRAHREENIRLDVLKREEELLKRRHQDLRNDYTISGCDALG